MRGLLGLHRKNVLIMTFFFIPVFWFGYANEKNVAVSRWKIMCAYCMNIELILSKWCLDHLLIKVGRTFGGVIVLNVCHLDRLSHDHWTENVAALYIDPKFFLQHGNARSVVFISVGSIPASPGLKIYFEIPV